MRREILSSLIKSQVDFEVALFNSEFKVVSNKLFNLFKRFKDHKFVFVEPGGNYGDYLIYKGAYKLANFLKIQFHSVNYQEFMNLNFPREVVIYIHGSGGYLPWWSGRPIKIFRKATNTHRGIVILGPTSFFSDHNFLQATIVADVKRAISKKIFIFTREAISYKELKKCLPASVEVDLDHDTALNLSWNDIVKRKTKGRFILYAIREDKESINVKKRDFLTIWVDPPRFCYDFNHWIAIHYYANKIITNRLHSAILGVILEKPTILIPNNYHKNHAVWEYSLSQRGVQWLDYVPIGALSNIFNYLYPLKSILSSPIFHRVLKFIYKARYKDLYYE